MTATADREQSVESAHQHWRLRIWPFRRIEIHRYRHFNDRLGDRIVWQFYLIRDLRP